jgi:WD40 repeat protein
MRRGVVTTHAGNMICRRLPGLSLCCLLLILLVGCGNSSTQASSTATVPSVPSLSTPVVTYKGHSGPVINVVWSPDGTRLASCGNDGTVQV